MYGLDEEAVIESLTPTLPIHFEATTPWYAKLHLKADDQTVPACLHLDLRIDIEKKGGETKTISRAEVVGQLGPGQSSAATWCPNDHHLAPSEDGTTVVNVTLPPTSIRTVDLSSRLYLNLTARTDGLDHPETQPHRFRLVYGPAHSNHLTLPIHDAIHASVNTTWSPVRGLVFDVAADSPLGTDDVRPPYASLRVVDRYGTALDREEMIERGGPHAATLSCSRCAQNIQLDWPLAARVLEVGPYTAEVTIWNTQRTARTTETIPFTIGAQGTLLSLDGPSPEVHYMDTLPDDDTTCPVSEPRCVDDPRRTASAAPALVLAVLLLLVGPLTRRHRPD